MSARRNASHLAPDGWVFSVTGVIARPITPSIAVRALEWRHQPLRSGPPKAPGARASKPSGGVIETSADTPAGRIARVSAAVSCPLCGSYPIDDDDLSCPGSACPCFGLLTSSPEARDLARRWLAGERPWKT